MPSVNLIARISVPKQNEHLRDFKFSEIAEKSVPIYCRRAFFTTSGWVKSDAVEYKEELLITLEWEASDGLPQGLAPRLFSKNLLVRVSHFFGCELKGNDLREKGIYLQVFQKVD